LRLTSNNRNFGGTALVSWRGVTPSENVPLAPLTTLKVGGPAHYYMHAGYEADVIEAVHWAQKRSLPIFVLGGGSNLVVADSGFPGLVIHIAISDISESRKSRSEVFDVGAGMDWDALVAYSVHLNCGGIECMSGIPGTVGGTPVQNVGAYGQEVAETITSVRVFDIQEDAIRELANKECGFAYRASIFNTTARGRYVVLRVRYALKPDAEACVKYADVQKYFAGQKAKPSLIEVREAVRQIRLSKAMLIVEGDPDACSAGSFFKNPVISLELFKELTQRQKVRGQNLPHFPADAGKVKISAAWLVEHAGFGRGTRRGHVGISSKHALAIVNRGGASAAEIIALKDEVQAGVEREFGIRLEPEPVLLGF
jgi:UDP-N-acetylmuramate dehydrogenase